MAAALSRRTSSLDDIRGFFDQWHVYDLLVQNDYMSHTEIHAALKEALSVSRGSPFSVMDLGCGDASMTAQTLRNLPVTRYVGVDLSRIALEIAKKSFAWAAFPKQFVASNLSEYLERSDTPAVDVAIAGFAVHHLQDDEKRKFFTDCAEKLSPGGDLYLFDVFRKEDQSREAYLDSYCGRLETEWTNLSSEQKASISEHIRTFDFPVSYKTMRDFAQRSGFETPAKPEFMDSSGFHRLYRFRMTMERDHPSESLSGGTTSSPP